LRYNDETEVSEMEKIPRGYYTRELREEAVKLVVEGGESIPEVGRRLSISSSTIRYWVKASKEGKLQEVGKQEIQEDLCGGSEGGKGFFSRQIVFQTNRTCWLTERCSEAANFLTSSYNWSSIPLICRLAMLLPLQRAFMKISIPFSVGAF
jgi:hypothetical protein